MVKIAGSKKLKRQMAPSYWGITRKNKRFVVTVKPGSHKKDQSIPTSVFLRDTLKIVSDLREAKYAIYNGKVSVDGVKIKSIHHGIGLMDVVELEGLKEIYRLVPSNGILLKPIIIQDVDNDFIILHEYVSYDLWEGYYENSTWNFTDVYLINIEITEEDLEIVKRVYEKI